MEIYYIYLQNNKRLLGPYKYKDAVDEKELLDSIFENCKIIKITTEDWGDANVYLLFIFSN